MFTRQKITLLALVIAGFVFLTNNEVAATHIVGGDLTYQCLGSTPQGLLRYRIRLTIRRDCQFGAADAPFDNPAAIGLYDLTTGAAITPIGFPFGEIYIAYNASDTLNEQLMSDCSVVSGPVCVETFVYDTIVQLPYRPSGYIFAYQRCCRNQSLNNILDPLSAGMTLVAELTGSAQLECNSSPQFGIFPPVYTCVNREIVFDHSAIDLEGDSLVYELCTPLSGGTQQDPQPNSPFTGPPYETVVFRPPYSLSNVMGGVPLQIDPHTGLLTGTPNTIGQFVVGICVTAYKNGVMTGKTRRDFQFNVRQCRDVPTPAFFAPALDCEDLTVTFDNQSQLADQYQWLLHIDDTTFLPFSDLFEPTFTFPGPGFYDVSLVVNVLEGTQVFCLDTVTHQVGVFDSQIDAAFTYDVSSCTEDGIVLNVTDQSFGFDPNYPACTYEWLLTVNSPGEPSQLIPSTVQHPTFTFDIADSATATLVLVVTACNGCSATQVVSFPLRELSFLLNPASDSICAGESTHLLLGGNSNLDYTWSPAVGLPEHDPVVSPLTNTTYCVTLTDGLCTIDTCTTVAVQQLPVLAFTSDTDCRSLTATFDNNSSPDAILFEWNFGDGSDSVFTVNPTHTFPDSGIYTVTLISRDGCDVSTSQQVTINDISEELSDDTTNCFISSVELNPVNNPLYTYVWSHPELLDSSDVPNPIATVTNDTEFCVTISSASLPGCEIEECITVIVPDLFTVDAGNDTATCTLDSIPLTAILTTTSTGEFDFVWTNEEGDIIGLNPSIKIYPDTTLTFFITVTDSLGCTMSDQVQVIRQPDEFDVEVIPEDTSYCGTQSIEILAFSLPAGATFEWFDSEDMLIGDDSIVLVSPGAPDGRTCYYVIATDPASRCEVREEVCLTPTEFNLSISPDQLICLEQDAQLSVTDNAGQPLTYIWSPIEFLTGGMTSNPIADPPVTTEFCVTVTNTLVGCIDSSLCTTVTVSVFNPTPVVVTSDPNPVILTQPAQLTVNQPSNYGYQWEVIPPTSDVTPPPINNPVVHPTTNPTIYQVTVTNEDGCTQVASISVNVDDPLCNEKDIFVPNAFTPNGDGHNDVHFVESNYITSMSLHIYNRWGEEVFVSNSQSNGWNGTFKGKQLPPDVYGYYIDVGCPNNKTYFEKGNITLLE